MQFSMEMLKTHPRGPRVNIDVISECIQACYECARTCTDCADACLGEEDLQKLVRCIRLDQDCADICETTGRIMSRQTEPAADILKSQLETCITACRICGFGMSDACHKLHPLPDLCRLVPPV